jgi:hypothetical protein
MKSNKNEENLGNSEILDHSNHSSMIGQGDGNDGPPVVLPTFGGINQTA